MLELSWLRPQRETTVADRLHCPSCGSPVDPDSAVCSTCGTPLGGAAAAPAEPPAPSVGFECKSCGAQVACEPGRPSQACAFCGSTYVVEVATDQLSGLVPELILPFRIDREEAQRRFESWGRSDFLAPADFRKAPRLDRLEGVYLPFWTFSMKAESEWTADIGEHWYETREESYTDSQGKRQTRTHTVQHTEWYPLSGRHHSYFFHHLVSGSRGLSQEEMAAVSEFDLLEIRRYRPQYLAGWSAESFGVPREEALAATQQLFQEKEGELIPRFLPGDTQRDLEITTRFEEISDDLLFLPFWIGSFSHRGKPYRFVLNGQTGEATGTLPTTPWKKIAITAVILVALILIIWLSWTTSP
jgi:hypothetical protein